jgi:peroxiredoxin
MCLHVTLLPSGLLKPLIRSIEMMKLAPNLRIMRYILFSFFLFISMAGIAQGQKGYNLKFKVEGWKDTTVYLGHSYGEATYIKDTARVNSKGEFFFDNKKELPHGVYFLVLKTTKMFEFLVSNAQFFTMETKDSDPIKEMKITGDPDNRLFFDNMLFNADRYKEAEPFTKILQDSTLSEDQKKDARAAYGKINDKVVAHQQEVIARNPGTLTAIILKANTSVKVPEPPKRADGRVDSTFQLRWYREHFFDNFDLANDALIRMPRPIYSEKINEYLDRLYAPQPDSVTKAIDKIIAKAKKNQETYKYATWICLLKYQQPEIMGMDEVYVNVYDKYFASGEMNFWTNEKLRQNLKDVADRFRKSLVGKQAPNMIMQDSKFQPRSMYDLKTKYTVVYIFDPDCGHCKTETPKLVKFYEGAKAKHNLEVYAVSTDTSMAKMRDYIKTMNMKWITVNGPRTYGKTYADLYDAVTTPSLFLLDEKKKIIAKKLPIEKLEDFITNYEKFQKAKAAEKLKGSTNPKL